MLCSRDSPWHCYILPYSGKTKCLTGLNNQHLLPNSPSNLSYSFGSFGSLMTAALESDGIPAYVISIARGLSAMIGISATYAYPVLQSHISTIRTGIWSIWSQVQSLNSIFHQSRFYELIKLLSFLLSFSIKDCAHCTHWFNLQWAFLLVCLASIWVQNEISSAYMLMAGVAASRLGLWMFDLAVIQQMQVTRLS